MSVSFGGGSSRSRESGTTTATARALEKEEKDLLATQNEVLKVELAQITRQNQALEAIFPESKEILRGLTAATTKVVDVFSGALDALKETPGEREIRGVSEQEALKTLRGEAPLVTPQEQTLLDRIFETERTRGLADIRQIGEEAAAARGLHLTDTPIGREVTESARKFSEGLAAEKARTTLDVGRSGQQFREAVRQFQEGLRFQAQQNRLALTGMSPFALNPPISTVSPAQAGQTVASTLAPLTGRPVSTAFTRSGSGSFDTFNAGINLTQLAGAAGGSMFTGSSARLKKNILPLDPEEFERAKTARGVRLPISTDGYDEALLKLRETPVTRWRYRWERDDTRAPHIGPILELSPEEIREDDTRINLLDYIGLTHAGVKALDRTVTRLALDLRVARPSQERLPILTKEARQ